MILVETDVSDDWGSDFDWPALADRSVRAAIRSSRHGAISAGDVEVSVKFTSDDEIRALNAAWRGKDRATNVLSFPMVEDLDAPSPGPTMLGDIALAHGICAAEAQEKAVAVEQHASHLLVHGTLHLLGYDHETDEGEAEMMEEVERQALASIGIADPYKVTEVQS